MREDIVEDRQKYCGDRDQDPAESVLESQFFPSDKLDDEQQQEDGEDDG